MKKRLGIGVWWMAIGHPAWPNKHWELLRILILRYRSDIQSAHLMRVGQVDQLTQTVPPAQRSRHAFP